MARGATKAARRARADRDRQRMNRAQRARLTDGITRAQIATDFEFARQDWSLVRCEACGCEQGSGPYPCAICGHGVATYA